MIDDKNKKVFSNIKNITLFLLMLLGVFMMWQYKAGLITKREAMFYVSVIVSIVCLADLTFSILYKESVAKGVIIKKNESPNLYMVSVVTTLLLLLLALVGIYYYR